jgi:peptidoglycan hydrolase-like protein with peptidoglycan-binding domain
VNEVQGDLQKYAPPTSAAAQPLEGDVPVKGKGSSKALLAAAKYASLFLVIALGVALGMSWSNQDFSSRSSKKSDKSEKVDRDVRKPSKKDKEKVGNEAAQAKAPEVAAAPAGANDNTTNVAAAGPTPTPRPTPKPITYDNWQLDPENTVRVNMPKLTEAASYVNLIHRWNIDVDLETFRGATPDEVANFNLSEMVKPLNFTAYRADSISEAFKLNLPVLARIRDEEGKETWTVISAFNGEVIEVIDPIRGKRMLKRQKFEPMVIESVVLYQDPTGLTQLKPGDPRDQVIKLQNWLAQERCFEGTPDGKFGQQTREAIEKFQLNNGLKETGRIDELTGAIMASRLNPRRPRLYQ